MHRSPRLGALASVVFAFTSACGGSTETIEGWSEESHGKNAAPAYAVVFPQEQVKRFDLTIAPADWQKMQDDMTAMAGEFGAGGGMGPGGGGGGPGGGGGGPGGGQLPVELTAPCVDKAAGDACTATFQGNTFTSTCAQGPGGAQLLCRPQFGGGVAGVLRVGAAAGTSSPTRPSTCPRPSSSRARPGRTSACA